MNLWMKLSALARGQFRESAERVIDQHSLCIFEQEIIDCERALVAARQQLALVIAEKMRLQREQEQHEGQRRQREQQARAALDQNNEELALEVAAVITELSRSIAHARQQLAKLDHQESSLRKRLRDTAKTVADYRRELGLLKATASAQAVSGSLHGCGEGMQDRVAAMQESLLRIRARQQAWDDQDKAFVALDQELVQGSLDDKLRRAGIQATPDDARAVLERLRRGSGDTETPPA